MRVSPLVTHIRWLLFLVEQLDACSNHIISHKNEWYADLFGCFLLVRHKFKVISACFVRLFHNCSGHSLFVQQKPLMMWFLKVCIALPAAFTLWFWGSTNCHLHSFVFKNAFSGSAAWLSVTFSNDLWPFYSILSNICCTTISTIVSSLSSLTSFASIKLLS